MIPLNLPELAAIVGGVVHDDPNGVRSILEAVAYRQGLAKAALDPPKGS